jgi:hypothetical protein
MHQRSSRQKYLNKRSPVFIGQNNREKFKKLILLKKIRGVK